MCNTILLYLKGILMFHIIDSVFLNNDVYFDSMVIENLLCIFEPNM
jgi:hypothetical protein